CFRCAGEVRRLKTTQQTAARHVATNQVVLNYMQAMTQAQESLSAVIYDRDTSLLQVALQKLQAKAAPDAKAEELRHRLLELLMKAGWQGPEPTPGGSPVGTTALKERQDLLNKLTDWKRG